MCVCFCVRAKHSGMRMDLLPGFSLNQWHHAFFSVVLHSFCTDWFFLSFFFFQNAVNLRWRLLLRVLVVLWQSGLVQFSALWCTLPHFGGFLQTASLTPRRRHKKRTMLRSHPCRSQTVTAWPQGPIVSQSPCGGDARQTRRHAITFSHRPSILQWLQLWKAKHLMLWQPLAKQCSRKALPQFLTQALLLSRLMVPKLIRTLSLRQKNQKLRCCRLRRFHLARPGRKARWVAVWLLPLRCLSWPSYLFLQTVMIVVELILVNAKS